MEKKIRNVANKTIRIFGKECVSKDGNKFVAYSFTPDGQQYFKVQFTKKCETTPKESGYYILEVNPNDISIKRGQVVDGKKYNDTMFVDKVVKLAKDTAYEEKAEEQRFNAVMDVLNTVDMESDELPWK